MLSNKKLKVFSVPCSVSRSTSDKNKIEWMIFITSSSGNNKVNFERLITVLKISELFIRSSSTCSSGSFAKNKSYSELFKSLIISNGISNGSSTFLE